MITDLKAERRRYRHLMRQCAKETGRDLDAATAIGLAHLDAIATAPDVQFGHTAWFDQPQFCLDGGFLVQDLRTGGMAVHALATTGSHSWGQHHKAHRARSPEDALRLLRGPVAKLTATARLLTQRADQRGLDITALYTGAMDQIVRLNPDPTAPQRLEQGLELLRLLDEAGVAVERVTVEHGGVMLHLPKGGIIQKKPAGYQVGYRIDVSPVYRVLNGESADPAEALRLYLEDAVPVADEKSAERRREREAREADLEAERQRQQKVIADYEALAPEVRAAASTVVEYLEVALARVGAPLGLALSPFGSPKALLERIESDGMPEFSGGRRTSYELQTRDLFKAA